MQHWLIKSEPDVFSIDDLARVKREPWTGVRNYQARNFMWRDMKPGDLALFYHSNAKPPGIAGVAKVAGVPYPDATQFDPKSEYFDAKATKGNPRWWLVDFEFAGKFGRSGSVRNDRVPAWHPAFDYASGSRPLQTGLQAGGLQVTRGNGYPGLR